MSIRGTAARVTDGRRAAVAGTAAVANDGPAAMGRAALAVNANAGLAALARAALAAIANAGLAARACALVTLVLLAGCSSRDDDLNGFIAATKKEPGGRVEPLPEVKPYESFIYSASSLRSPFMPGSSSTTAGISNIRPDSKRNREFLEQFSLDTLKMVGTLKLAGHIYGLVQTKDGLVHRVAEGNYLGQREGRITEIAPSKINLVEIVPDGLGGYMERPAALALNE